MQFIRPKTIESGLSFYAFQNHLFSYYKNYLQPKISERLELQMNFVTFQTLLSRDRPEAMRPI